MTQGELDVLPEMGGIVLEQRVINGRTLNVPVVVDAKVLWTAEDEPCAVTDSHGQRWMLGWYEGVRYKRRAGF